MKKDICSDFLVHNKGWLRWEYPNGELIIFSDNTNKSNTQIINERCELNKDDKIIWVKDLPINILSEYKEQIIKENK